MATDRMFTFEYRDHRCLVYKDSRCWNADITPPGGIASAYLFSPFRSRFLGRTMERVMGTVDHAIAFEDGEIARYEAIYDSPPPPRTHRKTLAYGTED